MAHPFVFACIAPHGLPIIPELAQPDVESMAKTRGSMVQLGQMMRDARPETIIVLTPHGLRVDGQFSVVDASFMSGRLSERTVAAMVGESRLDDGAVVQMTRLVDRDLAKAIIATAAQAQLPVASLNFQTSEGVFSDLPLDWGVMVPLYFMPDVPIVVLTPSRKLSYEQHRDFGRVMADAVHQSGKRVGLIASCDWSHTHAAEGPYGLHEDAAKLDAQVVTLLQRNDFEAMTEFDSTFIENAKPDGIWQSLMLAGAIHPEDRQITVLSYEAPTYFGLICAAIRPRIGK